MHRSQRVVRCPELLPTSRLERVRYTASVHILTSPTFIHSDKVWDAEEIQAVYGVHHVYSQKKSKARLLRCACPCLANGNPPQDELEHQKKADHIVGQVLRRLDKNRDGKITLEEFEAVGVEGLPSFDELGAEGHHYDVESGTCLVRPINTTT